MARMCAAANDPNYAVLAEAREGHAIRLFNDGSIEESLSLLREWRTVVRHGANGAENGENAREMGNGDGQQHAAMAKVMLAARKGVREDAAVKFLCENEHGLAVMRAMVGWADVMDRPMDEALREVMERVPLPWHAAKNREKKKKKEKREKSNVRRRAASISGQLRARRESLQGMGKRKEEEEGAEDEDAKNVQAVRNALKEFAEQYWKLNSHVVGEVYESSRVVFSLVIQLHNLFKISAEVWERGARKSVKQRKVILAQAKEREWPMFSNSCQDIVFSLTGNQLNPALLSGMFERILSEPLHRTDPALQTIDSLNGCHGLSKAKKDCFEGQLWIEDIQKSMVRSQHDDTQKAIPPALCKRIWFVLEEWVLYGYGEPFFPEPSPLLFVMPLGNVQPLLQFRSIQLMGTVKLALGPNACKIDVSSQKKKTPWFHLPRVRGISKRSNTQENLLVLKDVRLLAQTAEDAERWYHQLNSARKSSSAEAVAGFARRITRKKHQLGEDMKEFESIHEQEEDDLLEEVLKDSEPKQISGFLFVKGRTNKDENKVSRKKASSLESPLHGQNAPRKIPPGYDLNWCTLIGETLYLGDDNKKVDKGTLVHLGELRIVIPSTDSAALSVNAFPFELIRKDLKTICFCAAPTLKEYTVWFNAISGLVKGSSPSGTTRNLEKTDAMEEEGEDHLEDLPDEGSFFQGSPNGSVFSEGDDSEYAPVPEIALRIDTPESSGEQQWESISEKGRSHNSKSRMDQGSTSSPWVDRAVQEGPQTGRTSNGTVPFASFAGGYSLSPDTTSSGEVQSGGTEQTVEEMNLPDTIAMLRGLTEKIKAEMNATMEKMEAFNDGPDQLEISLVSVSTTPLPTPPTMPAPAPPPCIPPPRPPSESVG